jgi:adenosine kinase
MGNPLLDIQVTNGEAILEKYKLKANDAILAGHSHMPIYEEIVKDYEVTYVAGGSAQNAARGAAYVLPPDSVVYTGCVGDDGFADRLRQVNTEQGVGNAHQIKKGAQTGACAVIITGHHRSLVTTLRSAEKFELAHLSSPEVATLIDNAKFFYLGGYFLTHGVESALYVAKKAATASKVFAVNLSAPFIPQFFKMQLEQILPYCDYVIGNESEAEAYALATGLADKDPQSVALVLARFTKANASRPRVVVITQGSQSTVVATSNSSTPKVYPVPALKDSDIIDTNGAGDMFAGGFMGALVAGKSVDEAVEIGHRLGQMCVGQIGPQLKWPKEKVL